MTEKFDNINEKEIAQFYNLVSNNVKKFRQEKGISQMDLGLEIGIRSVAFFSNAECNRYGKHFNLEHIYKIAKALDTDICHFLEQRKD